MDRYRKLGGNIIKVFLFIILFIAFLGIKSIAYANNAEGNDYPGYGGSGGIFNTNDKATTVHCEWQSGAFINCSDNVDANRVNYYYDPRISANAGHSVFVPDNDHDANKGDQFAGYLHMFPEAGFKLLSITKDENSGNGGLSNIPASEIDRRINPTTQGQGQPYNKGDTCTVISSNAGCHFAAYADGSVTLDKATADKLKDQLKANQKASRDVENKNTCESNGGALSFIFCPLIGLINNAIGSLIGTSNLAGNEIGGGNVSSATSGKGLFISFLQINISEKGLSTVIDAFKNIANALFVVIFLVIIFSNTLSIGLDNYTIKKMLPKFVVSVILVQFSYFIVAALIDIGNILGIGVVAIINGIAKAAGAAASVPSPNDIAGTTAAGIGGNLSSVLAVNTLQTVGIPLVIILAIVALVSIIVSLAAMLFRQFAIVVLAMLAPLAFVAWVLPNTEKYFKMWWENLLKAIMMFPLITGMLALSLFLSQASAFMFGDNQVSIFLGAIFPLIALILVPKTFKWSGQLMAVTGGAVAGYMAGKAKGPLKESAIKYQKGAREKLYNPEAKGFGGTMKNLAAGGGFGVSKRSRLKQLSMMEAQRSEANKLAGAATKDQLVKMANTGSREERIASIGRLAEIGARDDLLTLAKSKDRKTESAYTAASAVHASKFESNIDLRRLGGNYTNVADLKTGDIAKVSDRSFQAMFGAPETKYDAATGQYVPAGASSPNPTRITGEQVAALANLTDRSSFSTEKNKVLSGAQTAAQATGDMLRNLNL